LKFSASNIAWPTDSRTEIYRLLSSCGFAGVEIAPTKFSAWEGLNSAVAVEEGKRLSDYGLTASSYQAILFGRPDAQLLGSQASFTELKDHLKVLGEFAAKLSGGGPAVFGAPKNRLRNGLDEQASFSLGRDRFHELAETCYDYGLVLVLEPAPEFYGGDFLTTTDACADMVRAVDHPGFKLHIDTGCAVLEKAELAELAGRHGSIVGHVHLSRPNLVPFTPEDLDLPGAAASLSGYGYPGWYTLEMRETENFIRDIEDAADKIKSAFSGET